MNTKLAEVITETNRERMQQEYDHFCNLLWQECVKWMDHPDNEKVMRSSSAIPYHSFWRLQSDMIVELGKLEPYNAAIVANRDSAQAVRGFGEATAKLAMFAMMAYVRRRRDVANKIAARLTGVKRAVTE